jgi:hypothetical protein
MAIQKISTAVIADNSIDADKIAAGAITVADIPDGEISDAKIDTVSASKVTGEIGTSQIANDAVTSDKIANNNVTTDKIADGQITSAKMASDITLQAADYILDGISETLSDTAVDIFIYDTTKDSDGGAWRNRTQDTSWYNETLNTSTRGSRREFPSVAVIVAEENQVTIYDGDDPDLPMWMVFNGAQNQNILVNSTFYNLAAVNGVLCVGTLGVTINFISEFVRGHRDGGGALYFNGPYKGSIAERNGNKGWTITADQLLVQGSVNDVAMTVLPNAPIDPATGLPIPTIAVATDGGVSVIKDDGTVIDLTRSTSSMQRVEFEGTRLHINSSSVGGHWIYDTIPSGDETLAPADGHFEYWDPNYANKLNPAYLGWSEPSIAANYIGTQSASGGVSGVTAFDYVSNDHHSSMMAWITSSYNTGWMNGDIKLATLSDTNTANISGSELVPNFNFTNDVSGWYTIDGNNSITWNSGNAEVLRGGSSNVAGALISMTAGVEYVISINIIQDGASGNNVLRLGSATNGYDRDVVGTTGTGLKTITYTPSVDIASIWLYAYPGNTSIIDYVSVSKASDQDRSVNQYGIHAFGTITKEPVATGADLVAYSGFSSSNYLLQPYNSDLDFTGDFSITFWYYHVDVAANEYIVFRAPFNNGAPKTEIYLNAGNQIGCYINDMGGINVNNLSENVWHHISVVRGSGTVRFYVNGEQKVTGSSSADLTNTSAILSIGKRTAGEFNGINGKLALFRMSATAPSAEQIKKIYEDEKVLFQENAKATLHGSSDAVTALAYDDHTELLHIGTSSGRSVFQGLRRIDNTTDAVSTAISANKGMVAEQ